MRDIKFREPVFTIENGNDIFYKFHYWGCYGEWYHSPIDAEGEHQQYTGLKDKNGVEIYEGDILKNNGDGKNYVVEQLNQFIGSHAISISMFDYDMAKEGEIIGNIYENPNLLTK